MGMTVMFQQMHRQLSRDEILIFAFPPESQDPETRALLSLACPTPIWNSFQLMLYCGLFVSVTYVPVSHCGHNKLCSRVKGKLHTVLLNVNNVP